MDTRKVDHGTVTFLEKINFLQSNLLAAHSVWVNDAEVIVPMTSLFFFSLYSANTSLRDMGLVRYIQFLLWIS